MNPSILPFFFLFKHVGPFSPQSMTVTCAFLPFQSDPDAFSPFFPCTHWQKSCFSSVGNVCKTSFCPPPPLFTLAQNRAATPVLSPRRLSGSIFLFDTGRPKDPHYGPFFPLFWARSNLHFLSLFFSSCNGRWASLSIFFFFFSGLASFGRDICCSWLLFPPNVL